MRETQILRGLHKARAANRFATGLVPEPPMNTAPMSGQDQAAFNNLQNTPTGALTSPAAPPATTAPRNLRATTGAMLGSYNPIAMPSGLQLSRGTPYVHGPGTATSDSVPANLSRGEAVLPAKTVAKVGVENLARLIEQTNDGIAPARGGLRAGGHFADARVPPMADVAADLLGQKRAPKPPPGSTAFNGMANDLGARGTGAGPAPGISPEAQAMKDAATAKAQARKPPPMGNTSGAAPPPIQEAAPAPKSTWQQAKQWGSNQWDAARGRPTPGIAATPAAPAPVRPSVVKPVLGGLAAGAMGGAAGYAAAQAATNIGDPSNNPVRPNPTETEQVRKIPTGGVAGATPAAQPYNYFTDNETGRNVGNTLNAVSMIPGAGPVARGALGLGAGAISKTLKLAERPLVAGAVQGAAQGVRDVSTAAPANKADTNPFKAENDRKLAEHAAQEKAAQTPSLPVAVTDDDRLKSDAMLNTVFGRRGSADEDYTLRAAALKAGVADPSEWRVPQGGGGIANTNADMNIRGLKGAAMDTANEAWALRGAGIRASRDANGGLVLSNSTGPEKMSYVDEEGKPTTDYKRTRQYAEGVEVAGRMSALADKMTAERTLREDAEALNQPMSKHRRAAMVEMQKAKMQQQTAAASDATAREQNEINREHNQLTSQGLLARLGLDRAKYTGEMQREGSKSFDEYLKNDPSMYIDDPKGEKPPTLDERALARKRAYIAQTLPTVKIGDREMSLDYAFAHHPREAKAFAQHASNEHTLSEFANKYSKQSALGKGVAPGRVAVVDGPRAAELADLAANMHLDGYLKTKLPWINDQRVQIRGVGGPISVPLMDIINDPNGRAMLETLGRLPVSKQ